MKRINNTERKNKIIPGIAVLILFLISPCIYGQASNLKMLDHSDFAIWNTIQNQQISADGNYSAYRIVPGEGDPKLNVYAVRDSTTIQFDRVSKYQFDYDANILFGIITPHRDTLRTLERKKKEKKDWPADTLFILRKVNAGELGELGEFGEFGVGKIPMVTGYKVPAKFGGWLAYTVKADAFKKTSAASDTTVQDSTATEKPKGDTAKKKSKKEIEHLIIRHLATGRQDTFLNIKEYVWAERAPILMVVTQSEDSLQTAGVAYWTNFERSYIKKEKGEYAKLAPSMNGSQLAFLGNPDTTKAQVPPWELYYFDFKTDSAISIAAKNKTAYPLVSQHAETRWSEDGKYLFYGRAEMPIIRDTTLLPDETVKVEVWSTDDPKIFPEQNVNKTSDEKKSYTFVYDTEAKQHIPVTSLQWENAVFTPDRNGRFVLVYTDRPYQQESTWEGDIRKDLAKLDLLTGAAIPVKKGLLTNPRMSPGGKYAYGYSESDSTWWSYQMATGSYSLMNKQGLPSFFNELHDAPSYPNSYGQAGWIKDDQSLIFYDRYDMWSWSPDKSKTPQRITQGRELSRVHRYIRTDMEERSVSPADPWLIHVKDDATKSTGYTWFRPTTFSLDTIHLSPFDHSNAVTKSRKADSFLFQKENFETFPDLLLTQDQFNTSTRISDANPQQKEYAWGSIELYQWMDWDSVQRTGLLVKPPGYDTLRSYPTIVNFYERSSDELHQHRILFPHRSTINYAFYASRGYVIFNPDIAYETGKPGESAYQIVMSGVGSLVKRRIADPENLALQGHSWGGYQIAHIVTRTNQFKCAEAGAAVVNMTSAYGGIRHETGRARLFQYEKEQSRLGKTLWEDPQLYITNSPLFKINKIETPLLLMHNDADGAVPFEQGIEFYLALRRNGKKAWMLNYPGEPHWPVKLENRKDFQMRMSQFFDHYLKGAPMPEWMSKGMNALEVGMKPGVK